MSIEHILRICVGMYVLAIVVELVLTRRLWRFIWECTVLVLLVSLDALITNAVTGRVAFGAGTSSGLVVLAMFVCVVFGISARYVFYLRGAFSWLDLVKPLCISPIVLLPLIGSVQGVKNLETTQVISFALLAFQNGFFWQTVFERASPITQASTPT
jgi:hypothetical protein